MTIKNQDFVQVTPIKDMNQQVSPPNTMVKSKQKQMSLEFFGVKRKKENNDNEIIKKQKIEDKNTFNKDEIQFDNYENEDIENEESVDKEILALAIESDKEEENVDEIDQQEKLQFENKKDETINNEISIIKENNINNITKTKEDISKKKSLDNIFINNTGNETNSEIRSLKREQLRDQKKILKQADEEKKREAKQLKKIQDEKRRNEKKEKEEEERRLKREKIEAERDAKRAQKEAEKAEKQRRKEEEIRLREEKKKKEDDEKIKRKEELERKKKERLLEKQKIEEEKEQKRIEEETKKQKRSITNFFKVKSTSTPSPIKTNLNMNDFNSSNFEIKSDDLSKQSINNDFLQYFLPFHVKPNVKLANNINNHISSKWDDFIKSPTSFNIEEDSIIKDSICDENKSERAISVLQCLNSSSINEANRLFKNVPLKYLKFYENRKPAYLGTFSYTLIDIKEKDINLKLKPCVKITIDNNIIETLKTEIEESNPIINYDYDSDIGFGDDDGEDEDDDDEEGEDLGSADEEDDADEEMVSSDIEEFVETDAIEGNSNNEGKKRVMGPLIPVIRNVKEGINEGDEFGEYFTTLQWERMNENIKFPIDPYKDYWEDTNKKIEKKGSNIINNSTNTDPILNTQSIKMETTTTTATTTDNALDNITNISLSSSVAPMAVKKKVISNIEHLRILLEFVEKHKQLSLNTLAELAVKDDSHKGVLGEYSRAVVKNSVKANASFDKKNGWLVSKLPEPLTGGGAETIEKTPKMKVKMKVKENEKEKEEHHLAVLDVKHAQETQREEVQPPTPNLAS